ncbi:MAG: hypothetical protein HN975_02065 [Anaerolineae bacterium]|jgi:hypothetical protein|nr:hypothetical protein [Anaerolineae bacterium]
MSNAAIITNLKTRRLAISVELAAMGITKAGGLPNRASEGINVDHVGYRKSLWEEMMALDDLITQLESEADGSTYEISYGS